MTELSRRDALVLTAAAAVIPGAAHAEASKPILTFDIPDSPADPMSAPISIVSQPNRPSTKTTISVRAKIVDPKTPSEINENDEALKIEFPFTVDKVSFNCRLKLTRKVDIKTDNGAPQDCSVALLETRLDKDDKPTDQIPGGYVQPGKSDPSPGAKTIKVGKGNCVPPAISTLRLSTQPPLIQNDNLVTVKCFAPTPPLDKNKAPIWKMKTVTIDYSTTQADKGKRLLTVTSVSKNEAASMSDDGLVQVNLNLQGVKNGSSIGWLTVTWTVTLSEPAPAPAASNDLTFVATALIRFDGGPA